MIYHSNLNWESMSWEYNYNREEYRREWESASAKQSSITAVLEQAEPFHFVAERLSDNLTKREAQVFGDDAQVAVPLWKAMVFLRTTVLPSKVSATSVREPLVGMLVDRSYPEARLYVEDLIARYPGILPNYVVNTLSIEPDALREIMIEEGAIQLSPAERRVQSEQQRRERLDFVTRAVGQRFADSEGKILLEVVSGPDTMGRFRIRAPHYGYGAGTIHKDQAVGCGIDTLYSLISTNGLTVVTN
jgi:hypothetical protein